MSASVLWPATLAQLDCGASSGTRNSPCPELAVTDSSVLSFCWMVVNGWQYQSKPTQSTADGMTSEEVTFGPASIIMTFLPGNVLLISCAEVWIDAGVAPRHCGSSRTEEGGVFALEGW